MELNHFDKEGKAVMVDVGHKAATERTATAGGFIRCNEAFDAIKGGTAAKGDVLGVARLAGIMAMKKTPDLIPLAHPVALTHGSVEFVLHDSERAVEVIATAKTTGQTGVEMEALCGVSAALLTIYDMAKAIDKSMEIYNIRLRHKAGGKSGEYFG